MDKEAIKGILPHREPMLLIDEAEVIDNEAHGKKTITGDEWFLKGHFPGEPVVPGVILCEILAQSTCVLLGEKMNGQAFTPFFSGLDKVRFKHPVRPGDTLETVCTITKSRGVFYWAEGKGYVNGTLCVRAEFSFAILPRESEGEKE